MIPEFVFCLSLAGGDFYSTRAALGPTTHESSPVKNPYVSQGLYTGTCAAGSLVLRKNKKTKIVWLVLNGLVKGYAIQHNLRLKK